MPRRCPSAASALIVASSSSSSTYFVSAAAPPNGGTSASEIRINSDGEVVEDEAGGGGGAAARGEDDRSRFTHKDKNDPIIHRRAEDVVGSPVHAVKDKDNGASALQTGSKADSVEYVGHDDRVGGDFGSI